jgi:hypothetical protein
VLKFCMWFQLRKKKIWGGGKIGRLPLGGDNLGLFADMCTRPSHQMVKFNFIFTTCRWSISYGYCSRIVQNPIRLPRNGQKWHFLKGKPLKNIYFEFLTKSCWGTLNFYLRVPDSMQKVSAQSNPPVLRKRPVQSTHYRRFLSPD